MNNEQANFARSFDKNKKETFKVDGRSVNKKEYLRQIKEFNIQVDNLCMFLPQDRVQDFTKMNPQELLHNTQISVCDAPTNEAFNKLIELRSTQKNNASSNANIQTRLSDNRNRNEQLRTLIESNKMKEQLMAKMDILLKKKAWCEYDKVKEQVIVIEADLKLLNDKIKKKNNDLNPLRDKQQQLAGTKTAIKNAISKAGTSINAVFAEMDRFTDAADKCESDVNSEKQRIRNVISSVEDHAKQVEEMQLKINLERNELQKAKDALEADDSIRDRSTECDQKIEQIKSANEKLLRQRNTITKALDDTIVPSIRVCERKLANLNDTQRQRVDVLRNQFEDVYRAYEWLKLNRHRFRGKIFDPIMVEITVKQKENAKYIENVIAIKDLQAFVCTDKGDMSQLIKILRNDMNLQVNIAYSEDTDEVTFAATRDITDYPPSLGLYSYLIDMFHAPAPIVNYLCRISGIHQVGVGDDRTFQNASSVPNEFKVFFSTEHRFAVTISRYSNSKSVSSSVISDRNWLNVGTDNRLKEREEKNLAKWNKDSKEKKDSRAKIEVEIKKNEEKLAIVRNQKNEIQKRLQFVKLATDKLSKKAAELEALKNRKVDVEEESQKSKANIRKLLKTLLSVNKKRVEKLVEYRAHRLERMFAQQKLQVFEDSTGNVDEEIRLIQNEINTTSNLVNRVKERFNETNHRLKAIEKEALKLTDGIAPSHAKFKYRAKFDELPHSVDELQNEMDNMQGRIDCIRGVDPQIVAEYEERKKEIEELEKILVDEIARMQSLEKKIETLHARWLPVVETVVHTINDNFSEFFKKMGFVGEVELIRKEEVCGNFLALLFCYFKIFTFREITQTMEFRSAFSIATMRNSKP